jgi:hypothetical protein
MSSYSHGSLQHTSKAHSGQVQILWATILHHNFRSELSWFGHSQYFPTHIQKKFFP